MLALVSPREGRQHRLLRLCPGTKLSSSLLTPGSRLPSMEDILPESSCSEHRSLTRSESDPPVDVYLPGNSPALVLARC